MGRVAGLLPVLLTFLPQCAPGVIAAEKLEVDWRGYETRRFDVSSWDEKSDVVLAGGRRLLTGVTLNWNTSVHNLTLTDLVGDLAIKTSFESAFKTVVANIAGSYINVGDISMTIDALGIDTTITVPDNASRTVIANLTADVTTYVERLNTAMQGVTNIGTVSTGTVSIASMTALVSRYPTLNTCHASCSAPQYVTDGRDNELCKEGKTMGGVTVCTTQCKIGYSPSIGTLVCGQGLLQPGLFTCSPSTCEVPKGLDTKWPPCTQGGTMQHGDICTPSCPNGYFARANITCNFGVMSARAVCDPLPCSAPNGATITGSLPDVCREGKLIQHGNICTAQCAAPNLASPDILVCIEGQIIPPTFQCVRAQSLSCSAPASVTGAESPSCTQGANINSGEACTPSCLSGRKASVASLQCENGVLTPPTFQCRKNCAAPTGVTGLNSPSCVEGPTIEDGTHCTVMCSGSQVGSPGRMMCSDGTLAGVGSLVCQAPSGPPCSPPSGIVNMAPQACAENPIAGGGLCTGQCVTGYVASPRSLLCTGGSLHPPSFLCMDAPCNVQQPVSAATPACAKGVVDGKIQSGLTCEAKCIPGYVPFPIAIICRQGELTPPTFACRDWSQMGADFGPTSTDIFCTAGVACQLVGLKGKGLQAGDYLMLMSECGKEGATLQDEGFSATAITGTQCGTKFVFGRLPVGEAQMCWCPKAIDCSSNSKNFKKLIGTLRIRCPPGTYNNNRRCESSACTAPNSSLIVNANVSLPACSQGNTILHSGYCTTQCADAYKPTVSILNCRNSRLIPSTYACRTPATLPCPAPQLITYAAPIACKQGNEVPHQGNCTTQCGAGYTAIPSILMCDDGILDPPRFRCQESQCPIPSVAHAAAEVCLGENGTTSIRSGASCITQCIPGYVPFPAKTLCFRGEMPSFVCLDWANETEIADAGFGPQGEINLVCPLNADCTLNDLSGVGLQDDDLVMIMTECGAGGKPLYNSGFPETPLKSMKCGATVPMGMLSIETTTTGYAELCYCPKAVDCYIEAHELVSGPSPAPPPPVVHVFANNASDNSSGARILSGGDSTTTYASQASTSAGDSGTIYASHLGVSTSSQFNSGSLTTESLTTPDTGQLGTRITTTGQDSASQSGTPQATRIAGSFAMDVDSVAGFVNDPQAKAGVAKGISTVANVTENMVSVNFRVLRRLKAYSERLLSAGNGSVGVDYSIVVSANAPANMASDASSAMASVSHSALTTAVTNGINAVSTTNYLVSVTSITPPTVTVVDVTSGSTTPAGPANPLQYITVRRFDPSKFWKRVGRVNTTCPLEGNGRLGYWVNNSYCFACRPDSGLECGICAETKVKYQKNGENICSCSPGFFANASDRCNKCGIGNYCPGQNLTQERFECKAGATTLSETSQAAEDCKCDKGRFPEINITANITTCEMCNEGYYKAGIEDTPCREECMPNGDSKRGATRRLDCFCMQNFYYVPRKETCDLCPGEGITCPGGFIDDIPGHHKAPSADPGYYMTAYDKVAQCQIMVNDTTSVCNGGTYAESEDSCEEGSTGLICGACADGWTRDEPILLCGPCEDMPARWIMILGINGELIQKGALGLFMAQRAMNAALHQKKIDAVILRVYMQWLAISALLSQFDFSQVELYSWSQESKEMEAAAALMAAEEEAEAEEGDDDEGGDNSLIEMPEVEMKFEWPNWFQGIMSKVTFLSSVLQSSMVGSTQERLECMVEEDYGRPMKYIATTAFWACYPVFVIIYLFILALMMAKCAYPVYAFYFTKFMVMAFRKAGGYTHSEALEKLAGLSEEALQQFVSDPVGILTTPARMMELLGRDTCFEILAWQIFRAGGEAFHSRDMVLKCLERTATGVDVIRDFLQDPVAAAENLAETMQEILAEMGEGALEMAEDAGEALEALGEVNPGLIAEDALDQLDDLDEVVPTFAVFGFFETNGLGNICNGIVPIVLITVYSNWDFVTKRLLMAVQTQAFTVEGADGLPETQMRWMGDTRLQGHTGDHFAVAIIAYAGLFMWSFGFLAVLGLIINRSSDKLQDLKTLRTYGYFYNGYTANYWWWELGVKRIDVLLVYLCTYVSIFSDVKAKLILYNAIAAVLWAVHSAASPYDQRANSLIDRLESLGLRVRFFTLFLVQVLLLLDGSSTLCLVVACFVILVNGMFVIIVVITFIQETGTFGTPEEEDGEEGGNASSKMDNATKGIGAKAGGDSGGNPLKMAAQYLFGLFVKYVGRYILKFIMKYAMIPFHIIADVKAKLDEEVPHLVWNGVGLPIQVVEHHPGIALRNVRTRRYLTMNEDGTLAPTSRIVNKKTTFELSEGVEGAEEEGTGKLTGPYGSVLVEVITDDDGDQILVNYDGEDYRTTHPGIWWHPKVILRTWVSRHYRLRRRDQRNYIARGISETLSYLLVQGNVHMIPHNINDFVCLMPIAIRRLTEKGSTVDFGRASCRREVLDEIKLLIRSKHESNAGKKIIAGTLTSSLTSGAKFTHIRHSAMSDFMITPEEIMGMIVMLQRLNEGPLKDLIAASMDIIKRQTDKVDEERAKDMALKWAPKTLGPHQGDAGDDFEDPCI